MYKKVLITGMALLSSLNFCFGANIQCWEEYRTPWDSRVVANIGEKSGNFSASDSKLYNVLKDKATVVFVGMNSSDTAMNNGITSFPITYIRGKNFAYNDYVKDQYIALKFCAVFNDSSSATSTNATAAVNYIIKAK